MKGDRVTTMSFKGDDTAVWSDKPAISKMQQKREAEIAKIVHSVELITEPDIIH